MSSIKFNLEFWSDLEAWPWAGNFWSIEFGSVLAQWIFFFYPRIKSFIKPNSNILEIAPGYGRWTEFLIKIAKNYIGVDLCANCINVCKNRFKETRNTKFYQNDGKSLDMIEDNSIDFCISLDSLVHADRDAIEPYIEQLSKKLKEKSFAFIHHSNLGYYMKQNIDFKTIPHNRSIEIDYLYVRDMCHKYGLHCFKQELIKWNVENLYLDCCSLIYKDSSIPYINTELFYDEYLAMLQEYSRYLVKNYEFDNEKNLIKTYEPKAEN